jgi:hypothetical protein
MMADYRYTGIQQTDGNIPRRIGPAEFIDEADMPEGLAAVLTPQPDRIPTQHHTGAESHGDHHGAVDLQRPELLDCPPDRQLSII